MSEKLRLTILMAACVVSKDGYWKGRNATHNFRARNNSWIYAGQGGLSNPFLADRDLLLEGQNAFLKHFKKTSVLTARQKEF